MVPHAKRRANNSVLPPHGKRVSIPTMTSTQLEFTSRTTHRAWLATQAALPQGFAVGTARFAFTPVEVPKPARMTLTLLRCVEPTSRFAACFTKNAFPGAPVIIGRQRLAEPTLAAILINNKISNVCAPNGVAASERLCAAVAPLMGLNSNQILPCSTGVIGWQLPVDAMLSHVGEAVSDLQGQSILPAAEGIVTTDLYPKIRRFDLPGGASIVGIAKGAGMIEPNLATMLVYLLSDADLDRAALRAELAMVVDQTFNRMSIDSDTSTSDTVALLSSGKVPCARADFRAGLAQVCADLTEDIVRNGEGVHHVIRCRVHGAPDEGLARSIGKSIVNSPLFQCAVCGNDPNVGRLIAAIGKHVGVVRSDLDLSRTRINVGGIEVFADQAFRLDPDKEKKLVAHLKAAELYETRSPNESGVYTPPIDFPPHERSVEVDVDLGQGSAESTVLGADRTHEYISENSDYRS